MRERSLKPLHLLSDRQPHGPHRFPDRIANFRFDIGADLQWHALDDRRILFDRRRNLNSGLSMTVGQQTNVRRMGAFHFLDHGARGLQFRRYGSRYAIRETLQAGADTRQALCDGLHQPSLLLLARLNVVQQSDSAIKTFGDLGVVRKYAADRLDQRLVGRTSRRLDPIGLVFLVADRNNARQPRFELALQHAGSLTGHTAEQADDERAEQSKQRRGETGGPALERLLQRTEQLLKCVGSSAVAGRACKRPDDAPHRSDHVQQADERTNQPHEDQKAGHVAQQRLLVIDRLADLVNQRVHRFDGNANLLRSRQLFGDEVVSVAEQAGSFAQPSRSGTTIMAPKGVPVLLIGTYPYVVPHFLQSIERDDFIRQLKDEDEGHDDRKRKRA